MESFNIWVVFTPKILCKTCMLTGKEYFLHWLQSFTTADELDPATFEKNLKAQLEAGVDGLILGGSTRWSKHPHQSGKRTLLCKVCCRKSEWRRVPVILNIAESSTRDALKQAERNAGKNGALRELWCCLPCVIAATQGKRLNILLRLQHSTHLPIWSIIIRFDYKIEVTPGYVWIAAAMR